MKKKTLIILLICVALALIAVFAVIRLRARQEKTIVSSANAENFGTLLTDLVNAQEAPAPEDAQRIDADLAAIKKVSGRDYELAKSIADHWRMVFLDSAYTLALYREDGSGDDPAALGLPDSASHAIMVLGYELEDGEMQDELKGRCEAAAAVARAYPNTILVCSGGATGENNPEGHTEAGLMRDYLTRVCGIDDKRIFTDENAMTTAENAINSFKIMQANKVQTMTIVTSSYHQRWGEAVYHPLAELYRREQGYSLEIVGNYSYDTEPTVEMYRKGARIAAFQIAGILELPREVINSLPSFYPTSANMPNPWSEAASAGEAAQGAGVGEFILPEENMETTRGQINWFEFRYMQGLAEADGAIGAAELKVRKGLPRDGGDVSGDYTVYAHTWTQDVSGLSVSCSGNEEGRAMKAVWAFGDYCYSFFVRGQGDIRDTYGIDADAVAAIVAAVR